MMPTKINIKGEIRPDNASSFGWFFEPTFTRPKDVLGEIKNDHDELELIINSPGGSVVDASEIYTALRAHKGKITAKIVGLAASAASWIAMAADEIQMSPTALMMVHNSSTIAIGDSREMHGTGDLLSSIDEAICKAYHQKTKISEDKLKTLLDQTSWFNAEEAKQEGLIDTIMFEDDEAYLTPEEIAQSLSVEKAIVNLIDIPDPVELTDNLGVQEPVDQDSNHISDNSLEEVEIVTLEEFKNQYPDLYEEVYNLGVEEERKRIKDIEDISVAGFEEQIEAAKFESGMGAEEIAIQMLKEQKQKGADFLNGMRSNKAEVAVAPSVDDMKNDNEKKELINLMAESANGGKQ